MSTLHPTKTRMTLLHDVNQVLVYWHPDGTSWTAANGGQVTARIAELEAAGWVHLPGDLGVYDVRYWQMTDAGKAVHDAYPGGAL